VTSTSQPAELPKEARRDAARPGCQPGVILAKGVFAAGPVEQVAPQDAALVDETGEDPRLVGEEGPVEQACFAALQRYHCAGVQELFEQCRSFGLPADAARYLEVLKQVGLSAQEEEDFSRKLKATHERPDASAHLKRDGLLAREKEHYAKVAKEAVRLAKWLQRAKADTAAAALLQRSQEIAPLDAEAMPLLEQSMAAARFPWRSEDGAAVRWAAWAKEIVPAGGVFVDSSDPVWKRLDGMWKQDVVALRTRNLLFLSRAHDPAIVGSCLRHGEGAIRVLTGLLPPRTVGDHPEALEVRLHKSREDYLADGDQAPLPESWSAGQFSMRERLSRFYVPPEVAGKATTTRALHEVLAHELTHHYLHVRWARTINLSATQPGFWVVEGFAQFIAQQAGEMGRLGDKLDASTVLDIDLVCQMPSESLLAWTGLVDGTHADFLQKLSDQPIALVQPHHMIGRLYQLSSRMVYYTQSAALCFFMMNRRGSEGRSKLLGYLDDFYSGRCQQQGWARLGFDSAKALEDDFNAFRRDLIANQ
jgi:hypothetical protein